jgi:hypothetical protein
VVDSFRVAECRAIWTRPCVANGASIFGSDGICPPRSTMRAGTWSAPASWSTSQTAARNLPGSGRIQSPMNSGCACPLATVDHAGSSGALRTRWGSRSRRQLWPPACCARADRRLIAPGGNIRRLSVCARLFGALAARDLALAWAAAGIALAHQAVAATVLAQWHSYRRSE